MSSATGSAGGGFADPWSKWSNRTFVWELIRAGKVRTFRQGRRRLVPTADLQRYLAGVIFEDSLQSAIYDGE